MKTDQVGSQLASQSTRDRDKGTAVQHQSEAGKTSQHSPRRTGGSRKGRLTQEEQWAYGLGWFGIGLGLMELVAPRRLARMIGTPPGHDGLIRAMGIREVASGVSILTQRDPRTGVWLRVAGDALDLVLLGAAFMSGRSQRGRLAAATVSVAGAMLMDIVIAQQVSRGVETRNGAIPVTAALIINRSREELYRHWRQLSNLPQFIKHLERIEVKDERRSHWIARGPAGSPIEWDAEIIEDRQNERISWRSVDGMEVEHAGSVRFEPGPADRGTVVIVDMHYRPPLGTVGAAVAAWFGEEPNQTVKMDLRRFKQMMETGEVITTEGQPAGRTESTSWKYDSAVRR